MIRDRKGRFAKRTKGGKWRIYVPVLLGIYMISTIVVGLAGKHIEPEVLAYDSEYEWPPRVVQLEVRIEWTHEKILKEIEHVFPDAPIMKYVAMCEGMVDGQLDPNAFNPTNASYDEGIFQISRKYHEDNYISLGFDDMFDVEQNLAYARYLYDRQGLQPWVHSKPCWSKYR